MQAVKISCPHCSRSITIDAAKLPKQRASFSCPGCKGKVVVDPAEVLASIPAQEPEITAPTASFEDGNGGAAPVDLELPPGATLPPGVIIGNDASKIEKIQRVVEPFECKLEVLPDAESARARSQQDVPPLIFCVVDNVEKPPVQELAPLTSMSPTDRRRTLLILVADNLPTLDGKTAFLNLVNVTVATKDIEKIPTAVYTALDYHNRLHRPLFAALEAAQEGSR